MTNSLTPPPATAATSAAQQQPPRRGRKLSRGITFAGIAIAAVTVGFVAIATWSARGPESRDYTASVDGVSNLTVDVGSADLTVQFDAGADEARLDTKSSGWLGTSGWTLERDGADLRVDNGNWWRDLSVFNWAAEEKATLVLPASLEGEITTDLDVSSGALRFEGDVQSAKIDVSAGALTFNGASDRIDATVSAGRATVTTKDANTIRGDVSAGRLEITSTGKAPLDTNVHASAGSAIITLPRGEYAVTGDESAGTRRIDVPNNPSAKNKINAEVSAGSVTVRAE